MLGQAQLTLRDIVDFTKKRSFDITFSEKIKVKLLRKVHMYLPLKLFSLNIACTAIVCTIVLLIVLNQRTTHIHTYSGLQLR